MGKIYGSNLQLLCIPDGGGADGKSRTDGEGAG